MNSKICFQWFILEGFENICLNHALFRYFQWVIIATISFNLLVHIIWNRKNKQFYKQQRIGIWPGQVEYVALKLVTVVHKKLEENNAYAKNERIVYPHRVLMGLLSQTNWESKGIISRLRRWINWSGRKNYLGQRGLSFRQKFLTSKMMERNRKKIHELRIILDE